jgi:hypothetical protein
VRGQVVGRVDVALVEEDRDLGALLGHREEAAVLEAAAARAERPRPGALGLEHAGDADAHAAEPLGILPGGDVADVHAEEPGVVRADVVVELAEGHGGYSVHAHAGLGVLDADAPLPSRRYSMTVRARLRVDGLHLGQLAVGAVWAARVALAALLVRSGPRRARCPWPSRVSLRSQV